MNEILRSDDKLERCGLVMSDGTYVEIENIALEPEKSFEMNPLAVLPLLETGHVISTWHTHPNSDPNLSGEDHSLFLAWPDLTHIIIGRRGKKVVSIEYRIENGVVLVCS